MPTTEEHLRKAQHNEDFARWLASQEGADYHDWVLNASFYSALHFVEGALAKFGVHSANHGERGDYIRIHMRDCYRPYGHLKNLSTTARYHCASIPRQDFHSQVGRHLEDVKQIVRRLVAGR